MRLAILALAFLIPVCASAQTYDQLMREIYAENKPFYAPSVTAPVGPVGNAIAPAVVPVIPVGPLYPPGLIPPNQYGTGYSVVTTQRSGPDYVQQYLGIRGATVNTTVTSVVPNNAWGSPMTGTGFMYPYVYP